MNKPSSLFKFESFNEKSISNLKNALVYFANPTNFNDPFDCSITEQSIDCSPTDVMEIYKRWMDEGRYTDDLEQALSYDNLPDDYIASIKNGVQIALKDYHNRYLNEIGCTCFSECNENILMWSHYADGHRGFCIEFDTSYEPFNKVLKVNYSDSFPELESSKVLSGEYSDEQLFSPLLTKYTDWHYEKEWRAFHMEGATTFCYPVESVKSIYFGEAIDPTHIEILCLILQGQCENIKFYRAHKSSKKYEVEFSEIFYTPHLLAKQLDLTKQASGK